MILSRIRTAAFRVEPYTYAALRVVAGAMLSFHGIQKIIGWHAPFSPAFASQIWWGGIIELLGGVLIALGLFTRPAAFLASGTMAVAYLQFHWKFALADGKWIPTLNMGELAALYSFVFLLIAARGAGVASVSARVGGEAAKPALPAGGLGHAPNTREAAHA